VPTLCIEQSAAPTIDNIVIGKSVIRPPSYRIVVVGFAYSSWISMNAENKENTLFD